MRGYRFGLHRLIIFDEVCPATVMKQRKLFQAGPAEVQLGCSATNCYAYEVYVHKVMLVLCSNEWRGRLTEISEDDRAWLHANSHFFFADSPLWEGPGAADVAGVSAPDAGAR